MGERNLLCSLWYLMISWPYLLPAFYWELSNYFFLLLLLIPYKEEIILTKLLLLSQAFLFLISKYSLYQHTLLINVVTEVHKWNNI